MRCSACKARCDPNRSFCQRCGSAVFVDDATLAADLLRAAFEQRQQDQRAAGSDPSASARPNLPRTVRRRRQMRPERARPTPVPQASPTQTRSSQTPSLVEAIGSLIRLAFFFGLLYVVVSLWSVREVREVVVSLVRGERPDLQPLLIKLADLLSL